MFGYRRSEADKLEWERRAAEVQKQRLEAQRLKKRKRAEAEVEERALARLPILMFSEIIFCCKNKCI